MFTLHPEANIIGKNYCLTSGYKIINKKTTL